MLVVLLPAKAYFNPRRRLIRHFRFLSVAFIFFCQWHFNAALITFYSSVRLCVYLLPVSFTSEVCRSFWHVYALLRSRYR